MGCADSKEFEGEPPSGYTFPGNDIDANNEENIVCQICNVCFNTKQRAPLIICPSNHSVCKECVN